MLTLAELLYDLNDDYEVFNITKDNEKILENANQDTLINFCVENLLLNSELKMVYNNEKEVNIFL